jgi:hypothetical protein
MPRVGQRYEKPDHVAWVLDGYEAILLHMITGEHLGLNPQGARVWVNLMELGDLDAVVAALHAEFPEASPEQIRSDTQALVDQLVTADLLAAVPNSDA